MQRVVEDGRRIAAGFGANHFGSGTLAPYFQLLNGCRPKRVSGAHQNRFSVGAYGLRELADGRRLPGAIYADHQHHFRNSFGTLHRRRIRRIQNGEKLLFQQALEFIYVGNLLAISFLT